MSVHRGEGKEAVVQAQAPRVLFVCTAGMLRSATAAHWAHKTHGWNTRCAGTWERAIQPLHPNTLDWAEHVFVMKPEHALSIRLQFGGLFLHKIKVLNVEDQFDYMQPELLKILESHPLLRGAL